MLQRDALGGGFLDSLLFEFDGLGDLFVVAVFDAVYDDGQFVFLLFGEEIAPALGDGFEQVGEFFLYSFCFFFGFFGVAAAAGAFRGFRGGGVGGCDVFAFEPGEFGSGSFQGDLS